MLCDKIFHVIHYYVTWFLNYVDISSKNNHLSSHEKSIIKKNKNKIKIWGPKPKLIFYKKRYIGRLYLFIKNSNNRLDENLLYQWNDFLWIKYQINQLISTRISFTKNISNPKPDFLIVINTNISSIPKHQRNICPINKRNTNQSRITFQPEISKFYFLSVF